MRIATALFTKSYLAHARVLAKSLLDSGEFDKLIFLLADDAEGHFDPRGESFEIVTLDDLELPQSSYLPFQYDGFELCCALKPFLARWLLNKFSDSQVWYFDTDMYVYSSLASIGQLLEEGSVVLTPHALTPPLLFHPHEVSWLKNGAMNAGFFAVNQSAMNFLDWWCSRLEHHCIVDRNAGLFVDQKWLDLAPCYFSDIKILRDASCNVALWNIHERNLSFVENRPMVNGSPLAFFHFSGWIAANTRVARWMLENWSSSEESIETVRALVNTYIQKLQDAGLETSSRWGYSFNTYRNGKRIWLLARRGIGTLPSHKRTSDPFLRKSNLSIVVNYLKWSASKRAPSIRQKIRERRTGEVSKGSPPESPNMTSPLLQVFVRMLQKLPF